MKAYFDLGFACSDLAGGLFWATHLRVFRHGNVRSKAAKIGKQSVKNVPLMQSFAKLQNNSQIKLGALNRLELSLQCSQEKHCITYDGNAFSAGSAEVTESADKVKNIANNDCG
jgi:hypothetical protein